MSRTHEGPAALTLREQLGATPDPDFELKLLPGWTRRTPDAADLREQEAALRTRLMSLHRPDLFRGLKTMLHESHTTMRQADTVAYYVASEESEKTLWIPGSLVVSVRRPPEGGTLDEVVRHAIDEYAATPLFEDKRFIRFRQEQTRQLQGGTAIVTSVVYMTPIPGSHRRRALQLTASFGRPVEMSSEHPTVRAFEFAFDACVSTLRWVPPSSGATTLIPTT